MRVGPAHLYTSGQCRLGEGTHPHTGNADEMNMFWQLFEHSDNVPTLKKLFYPVGPRRWREFRWRPIRRRRGGPKPGRHSASAHAESLRSLAPKQVVSAALVLTKLGEATGRLRPALKRGHYGFGGRQAVGRGTTMEGSPLAKISERLETPPRHSTRSAAR